MSALTIQKGRVYYLSSSLLVMTYAATQRREPLYYALDEEDRRKAEEPLMATRSCWKKDKPRSYAVELDNLPVSRLAISGQSVVAVTPAGVVVTLSRYTPQERSGCPLGEPVVDEELLAANNFRTLAGYERKIEISKGDSPKGDSPKGDSPKGDSSKGDGPKGDGPKGRGPRWIWT